MKSLHQLRVVLLTVILWSFGNDALPQDHAIFQLREKVVKGDKAALFQLAQYMDSQKKVIEFFGSHQTETTESELAKRIVKQNCFFTVQEIQVTEATTKNIFNDFVKQRGKEIAFSSAVGAFIITPLKDRPVRFVLREVSDVRMQRINLYVDDIFKREWALGNKLDSLIQNQNPYALVVIASEFLKNGGGDVYAREFSELLQYLTGTDIGVEDEKKNISWRIEEDYYPESRLNLLIYFSKFWNDYKWDSSKGIFINVNHKIEKITRERDLFDHLNSRSDSVAMHAFIELTKCDPERVSGLVTEYERINWFFPNRSIPSFPFNFLQQLTLLNRYCSTNNIDITGSEGLKYSIEKLKLKASFKERRSLEDSIIAMLDLEKITAFEYWCLVHGQSYDLTFSAGRILDIFYSRNWSKLASDRQALDLYLKKSALFERIGIIGVCNLYLNKFRQSSPVVIQVLKNHQTTDDDVKSQLQMALALVDSPREKDSTVFWEGNKDFNITGIKKQLEKLTAQKDSDDEISEILSRISFDQIPEAMRAIENFEFELKWRKYSFLHNDFGFSIAGDFDTKEVRGHFLVIHSTFSEYDVYAYYLDRAGIDYKTKQGQLDFDKIYDLIKYNVVSAFAGGGGGKHDNEVYPLVKLLELTFKTTLGFPKKLCNSNNMYSCNSDDRAVAWMEYLTQNKRLKLDHHEPVSFSFGY